MLDFSEFNGIVIYVSNLNVSYHIHEKTTNPTFYPVFMWASI